MNRQIRANTNPNMHHNTNPPTINFDAINAQPVPPPPPVPGSLTDPANFPMIPNLMDLFLRNGPLASTVPTSVDTTNTSNTETTTTNATQSSPPVQKYESKFYFFKFDSLNHTQSNRRSLRKCH